MRIEPCADPWPWADRYRVKACCALRAFSAGWPRAERFGPNGEGDGQLNQDLCYASQVRPLFQSALCPERQPAKHFLAFPDEPRANHCFMPIESVDQAVSDRCIALTQKPNIIHESTLFRWWPRQRARNLSVGNIIIGRLVRTQKSCTRKLEIFVSRKFADPFAIKKLARRRVAY